MPTGSLLVRPPELKADGAAISAQVWEQIVELRVEHALSVPSRLTIRFADPDFAFLDGSTFDVGVELKVSFPDPLNTLTPVFAGEVVSVGSDQSSDDLDGCELVVIAYDHSHRLGHASRARSFQKMSYGDVVGKIASENGMSATVDSSATMTQHEYLLQSGTDYEFLNEIAFRLGHEWRVVEKMLHFGPRKDTGSPIELKYGEDLRRIKVRFTGSERTTTVSVRAWDPLNKVAIVGSGGTTAKSPGPAVAGTATLGSNGRTKANAIAGARFTTAVPASSTAEANEMAKGLGSRLASSELTMRGEALGNPTIKVGGRVTIKNAGTKLSGTYYISSVEHLFGRGGDYITRFATGGIEPASLVDLLGGGQSEIRAFGESGLCIGVVTNNKDPDNVGRVRVKLPALSDEVDSNWARVVTPGAANNRGIVVLPQVDDEVLVGFEHGDLRRPYVIGGLYNNKTKPPANTDTLLESGKVVQWNMMAGDHSLVLRGANAEGGKHFKLLLSDGKTTLYVGTDKVEVIAAAGKTLELKNDKASVVLTASGDVQIKGQNVTIESVQNTTIKGMQIDAKATTGAKLEGSTTLELKGGASAKLEASGITELKGSMLKIN